ncbi:DUF2281 domain-containing protein [Nostoc spongiaeforme FACHB-130]|uniref:DUF2281 domain-containing protein n=1 Tax=Nostoc spongiaeforme FACHB-130 TaxID=1357510 RepID=A0ABR8FZY5_9NOSO|nr:DUF2281 domain-containing protein [Nostoc spongiaeforme]MBD2596530.1 DUF2281 domain-containing protein [Nostoc spongiaeforme FACHB-130]
MITEQELLTKWRFLPKEKQEEVLDFVEFLYLKIQSQNHSKIQQTTPEELGWPAGFFEQTAGCLADDPIQRYPQGEYEQREQLD